jgi:hypothetical protein
MMCAGALSICRILQQAPYARLVCSNLRMEERQSGYRPDSPIRCHVGQLHTSNTVQVFQLSLRQRKF